MTSLSLHSHPYYLLSNILYHITVQAFSEIAPDVRDEKNEISLMLLKQNDIKLGMAGKRKTYGWDVKSKDKVFGIERITNTVNKQM